MTNEKPESHPHLLQRRASRVLVRLPLVPEPAVLAQVLRGGGAHALRYRVGATPQEVRNLRVGAEAQGGALGLPRLPEEVLHLRDAEIRGQGYKRQQRMSGETVLSALSRPQGRRGFSCAFSTASFNY